MSEGRHVVNPLSVRRVTLSAIWLQTSAAPQPTRRAEAQMAQSLRGLVVSVVVKKHICCCLFMCDNVSGCVVVGNGMMSGGPRIRAQIRAQIGLRVGITAGRTVHFLPAGEGRLD